LRLLADLLKRGVIDARLGKTRRLGFKDVANVIDLADLLGAEIADDGAVIGLQPNDADTCKPTQRLADGGSADADLFGDLFFDQPVAAFEFAGEDQLQDLLGDPDSARGFGKLFHAFLRHDQIVYREKLGNRRKLREATVCRLRLSAKPQAEKRSS